MHASIMLPTCVLQVCSCTCRSEEDIHSSLPPHKQRCFLVFESALMLLFTICSYCRSRCTRVSKTMIGSFLRITQSCSRCGYKFIWESQPYVGSTPAGNILLSAAILYSGLIPSKALRVFRTLKCLSISRKTFFRHQNHYLQPAINHVWSQQQNALLEKMKTQKKKLELGGDGRADSPGHSAKYGTYSLLELSYNKIIDFQLVQVHVRLQYNKVTIILFIIINNSFRVMRLAKATTWKRRVLAKLLNTSVIRTCKFKC